MRSRSENTRPERRVDEALRAEPLHPGPHDRGGDRGERQRGVARGAGQLIEVRARAREGGVDQHEPVDQLGVPGRDAHARRAPHRVAHHDGRAPGAEQGGDRGAVRRHRRGSVGAAATEAGEVERRDAGPEPLGELVGDELPAERARAESVDEDHRDRARTGSCGSQSAVWTQRPSASNQRSCIRPTSLPAPVASPVMVDRSGGHP